jgi:glc operon protein GlcG
MKKIKLILVLLVSTAIGNNLAAQVLPTYKLTLAAAKKIVTEAVKYANANAAPGGSIAIVDAAGTVIYLERLDNTFPKASEVSIEKAKTAAAFKMETKNFEDKLNGGRTALATVGPVMLQGGLPILYKGEVIGAIGVSGSKSADQDTEIAKAGIAVKFD